MAAAAAEVERRVLEVNATADRRVAETTADADRRVAEAEDLAAQKEKEADRRVEEAREARGARGLGVRVMHPSVPLPFMFFYFIGALPLEYVRWADPFGRVLLRVLP